jgi:hypothetical protein
MQALDSAWESNGGVTGAKKRRRSRMRSVRAATRREDHRGIDVVIESDVGKLFVQVKSSIAAKAKFEGRRRSARIVVVVVDAGDSLEAVLRRVVGGVGAVRGEYVEERARSGGRG